MAVTSNQILKRQEGDRASYPSAASTNHYESVFAFINSGGYADDDHASGANDFGGIVITQVDNSSGANGDLDVEVYRTGIFELTGSGFTQADIGTAVYATDNYTLTKTSTSNTQVGKIVGYISATKVKVAIDGFAI